MWHITSVRLKLVLQFDNMSKIKKKKQKNMAPFIVACLLVTQFSLWEKLLVYIDKWNTETLFILFVEGYLLALKSNSSHLLIVRR